jgi:hypothetical protein
MKQFPIFILIVFLIGLSSCKKDDNATNDPFPEWLQAKITELVPDQNLCKITNVTIIEYKGEKYYDIYCGLWSCIYCQIFDEQGNRPNWETIDWNDFIVNKKEIKVVPACQ